MKVITLSGAADIQLAGDATTQRDAIVAEAADITSIADEFSMTCATDAMRKLNGCAKSAEDSRVEVKRPVLDWGNRIDSLAKSFLSPVNAEKARLKELMDAYAAAQERKRMAAEAEAKRLADEKAKAEEAERKKQEEARQAEAAAARSREEATAAFTPEEAAQSEAAAKESERVAAEANQQAQVERERQATLEASRRVVTVAPVKPAGLTVRKVAKFEVTNIDELYASNPQLVRMEPNVAAINEVLRAGARTVPGLRIWEEVETGVRR